jgi:glycosyltransferase involved in cell wall biosynthesis
VRSLSDKVDLYIICEKGAFGNADTKCYELPEAHISHARFLTIHLSAPRILKAIEQIDPDIVHANYVHMLALISNTIRRRYPLIVTAHATPYRELQQLTQHPTFGWELIAGFCLFPYWHLVDRDVLHDSDFVLAVSPLVKRDLIQIYNLNPENVEVVPNAVDTDRFAPRRNYAEKSHPRRILSVGRLVHSKGLAQLIQSMRIICSEEEDVQLRIVGTGPEMNRLKRLAADLGLSDKIVFLGSVSRDILAAEYLDCDLVAIPSFYEPFSMVALEAMSSGKPVAMSPGVGIARLLPNDECYVTIQPSEIKPTARSILTALRDVDRLAELGRKGRLLAERRFSLKATATQMIEVYKSVLQKRSE